jgi:hypothetical protein
LPRGRGPRQLGEAHHKESHQVIAEA